MRKEVKKQLEKKQKESTQKLLSKDWEEEDPDEELRQQTLVEHFMLKAREVLKKDEDFVRMLRLLADFHEARIEKKKQMLETKVIECNDSKTSTRSLMLGMESLLKEVNAEKLMDELILFLSQEEAAECDKIFDYLYWKRFLSFTRKLEVFSSEDPHLLSRLHKTLTQLKSNEGSLDKIRIKVAVNKVLSGHPFLTNQFLSLFLDEAPSSHLLKDDHDFDKLDLTKNTKGLEDEGLIENICVANKKTLTEDMRSRIRIINGRIHFVMDEEGREVIPAEVKVTETPKRPLEEDEDQLQSVVKSPKLTEEPALDSHDSWSKDQDHLILSVILEKGDQRDNLLKDIAKQLNKSPKEVSLRLSYLIKDLKNIGEEVTSLQT